ncbi:unnamed protein product [Lepeophtheirus salmonis]|uniref:(salmon louse) hypothetical protein n=1 Tax=Lepeophtheirus salmonis TaxID=72036 RepID=A0A7R8CWS2_LEPSM|nr:unnamed protein product [Lepeophtheirus salmonis]CAF2906438.1 unnamed protein product [Lepeophtheirus salmonis]
MSEKKEVDSFCGAVIRSAKELKECENLEFLLGSWDAIRSGGGFEEDLHYEAGVILCSPLLLSLREASPGEKQQGGSFLRDEKSGSPGKDVGKEEFDLRPPQTDLTLLILGDLKSPWKKEDSQRKQSPLFSSPASLEPLDQDKIKHLSSIALGSLQTACSTASKYDENHSLSENQTLLESLEIFSSVLELFKSSTRIGGCVPQNFLCFGVKIIFSNLILESFTPLSACLCSKALEWFDIMIEDLTGFDGFQMDKK